MIKKNCVPCGHLSKQSEKQSCGFNISGLDCPDWFGKIWVGNVSLNSSRQIYASVLRRCGIYVRGNGGYMETTRIVIGQLCLLCFLLHFAGSICQ